MGLTSNSLCARNVKRYITVLPRARYLDNIIVTQKQRTHTNNKKTQTNNKTKNKLNMKVSKANVFCLQKADWPKHKTLCKEIKEHLKKTEATLVEAEEKFSIEMQKVCSQCPELPSRGDGTTDFEYMWQQIDEEWDAYVKPIKKMTILQTEKYFSTLPPIQPPNAHIWMHALSKYPFDVFQKYRFLILASLHASKLEKLQQEEENDDETN